jgi:hypothetical protein
MVDPAYQLLLSVEVSDGMARKLADEYGQERVAEVVAAGIASARSPGWYVNALRNGKDVSPRGAKTSKDDKERDRAEAAAIAKRERDLKRQAEMSAWEKESAEYLSEYRAFVAKLSPEMAGKILELWRAWRVAYIGTGDHLEYIVSGRCNDEGEARRLWLESRLAWVPDTLQFALHWAYCEVVRGEPMDLETGLDPDLAALFEGRDG